MTNEKIYVTDYCEETKDIFKNYELIKDIQIMLSKMNSNYILVNNGLCLFSKLDDKMARKMDFASVQETYDFVKEKYMKVVAIL